jgi:ATP-dependent DNA helicase PIF1
MPPHVLVLKKGVIIMLLRNLNAREGLCNGTRLIVEDMSKNTIKARIISERNKGDVAIIPRINLAPTDTTLPFVLRRRQFPVLPAFCITISKSQGQSYDKVGIDLGLPVFGHGQLYVALSRSRNSDKIKVKLPNDNGQGQLLKNERYFARNVVYKEIFRM